MDVAVAELDRGLEGAVGVLHTVVLLVARPEALEDLDRLVLRRLGHVDLLEAADQRPVLLEVGPELLVGRRADAAQSARGQRRLEDVGGVERAAGGGAGADDGVDLVDEEHGALVRLELRDHRLEALLEIAPVARAGEERSHVERVDDRALEDLGHLAADDPERQPLGDGRLADARIAHEERVVLRPPAEDLDGALDLVVAADEDVDLAVARLDVEVGAVGVERLVAGLALLLALLLVGTARGARLAQPGLLGDAVRDVVHGIEPRHALLLQEEHGVALALGEHGDENVGARDLAAPGGLDVDGGALDDALEAGRGLGVDHALDDEAAQVLIEEVGKAGAQPLEVDGAGLEDRHRVLVLGERHQEVLEGRVLVLAGIGQSQGPAQGLLKRAREHRHHPGSPTPIRAPNGTGIRASATSLFLHRAL